MDDASRQQKRKLKREQLKLGERVAAAGLSPRPARHEIIAIAEVLRTKLLESSNSRRASEAAALSHTLMDKALKAWPPRVEIACRKGCSYCCYSYVMVLPPEVFRIAEQVRSGRAGTPVASVVAERAVPLRGLDTKARTGAKLPCPLLENGMCSVYEVRPIVCRQATSLALQSCIDEFEGMDKDGVVEISSAHMTHAGNANVVMLGAMRSAGLPTEAYELSSALVAALEAPDTEAHWLAGADVFRDVPKGLARPAQVDQVAAQIAAVLRGQA